VLKPMVEIAPDFMHPTIEKTMVELLVELSHA
jgi:7,8-dihydro-6-hydroxymethylpterin-pyrophosphokinase